MADAARSPRQRPAWLPSAAVTIGVALELLVATSGLSRTIVMTLLFALAAIAVGVSLWLSMGLRRESPALRAIIAVPLALSLAATIVLLLESEFRRQMVRP